MKVLNIVGARPNFIKVAPIHRCLREFDNIVSKIVHTGQHYDFQMSEVFFDQLDLPKPDYFLGVNTGSHTQQTAGIMLKFEEVVSNENPDVILVVGDVNSTLACALVASKMHIPLVHVEAGLRCGDKGMPEEVNRILTDSISDHLFVTEQAARENLLTENIPENKIHFVGNVMIDTLMHYRDKAKQLPLLKMLNVLPASYILMTMHRASNVDNEEGLCKILEIVAQISLEKPVLFPIHPRTMKNIEKYGLKWKIEKLPGLKILEPQGYLEFLHLMENASLVITDSGGIQEETTYLNVPCITLRESTERPVTVEMGTNYLLKSLNVNSTVELARQIFNGEGKKGRIPPFWDGEAANRIVSILRMKYIK